MSLSNYIELLQVTAVITTVLQFLSGALICRKYAKKKSTGDSSGLPFLSGFLSCSFWLRYGLLASEASIILVNAIGALLFFIYVLTYYVFTVNKRLIVKQFGLIITILLCAVFYTKTVEPAEALKYMGFFCCIVSVCFFAAPLTNLLHIIRAKNSESLPFPLITMSFLVSLQWLIYGIIISDTFIQIPNFLGCILSLLQLSLFVCYPPKSFVGPGYKLVNEQI